MASDVRTAPVTRVLSGIRPSGALHLGHYAGVLRPWLACQESYDCFFMVADLQALAAQPDRAGEIGGFVQEVVLDWLAVGLDPERSHFVLQSQVPELAELTGYLQPLVSAGELWSNPTLRKEARWLGKSNVRGEMDAVELAFLGYPVSQVADMLLFGPWPRAAGDRLIVPVGGDQVVLVEFAREIARRFNAQHGPVFLEPEAMTSEFPRLPGIDGGSKMGKSLRNAVLLKEEREACAHKIQSMFTDPLRLRREDPGHPDACPCFVFRQAFGRDPEQLARRRESCLLAETDCGDCREDLLGEVLEFLAPIQERRAALARDPECVRRALARGTRRAREVAAATIGAVRDALHLSFPDLLEEKD